MADPATTAIETVIPALSRACKRYSEDRALAWIKIDSHNTNQLLFPRLEAGVSVLAECPDSVHFSANAVGDAAAFAEAHAESRLFYGYPVWLDDRDQLYPCFVRRCALEPDMGAGLTLALDNINRLGLNIALFKRLGISDDLLATLQADIADPSLSEAEKYRAVFSALGIDSGRFLDTKPDHALAEDESSAADGWYNCAIVGAARVPLEQRRALQDLDQISRAPLINRLGKTSLSAFVPGQEVAKIPAAQQTFEAYRLGVSQSEALRCSTHMPLTVAVAAPGTGPMALIIDQIVTAVLNSESVLYVADTPQKAAKISEQLTKLIGPNQRLVVTLGDKPANSSSAKQLCDAIYRMEMASAEPDDAEASAKAKKKPQTPDRRALAQLDDEGPDVGEMAHVIRQLHHDIKELSDQERQLALELGDSWSDEAAKSGAVTDVSDALVDWTEAVEKLEANAASGLLSRLFYRLTGGSKLMDLAQDIRESSQRLPKHLIKDIEAQLSSDDLTIEHCRYMVDQLTLYCDWRSLLRARAGKIRTLTRVSDSKSIELQILKHASSKASGARALFRAWFEERILSQSRELQRKIRLYFRIRNARLNAIDSKEKHRLSVKDGRAIRVLSQSLPIWVSTYGALGKAVPLEINLFDQVICDGAETQPLAAVLSAMARAKRATVIGAEVKKSPLPIRTAGEKRQAEGVPQWALPMDRSGLAILAECPVLDQNSRLLLADHFRAHPFIADFINATFYTGRLRVRTTTRAAGEGIDEETSGLHWHDIDVSVRGNRRLMYSPEECKEAFNLLQKWYADGIFRLAPRRTVGLVTPYHSQALRLTQRIDELEWNDTIRARILIGTPDFFTDQAMDLLIIMPGLSTDLARDQNRLVASDGGLYHDVIGLVRAGIHIVGDRAATLESGGYIAELSTQIGELIVSKQPLEPDPDQDFDDAFGGSEQAPDFITPLVDMLRQENIAFRSQLTVDGQNLRIAALSAQGGRYNIELTSDEHPRSLAALNADFTRDRKVEESGYHVIRVYPHDLIHDRQSVIEQIRHIV